jgi:hypothetical protein
MSKITRHTFWIGAFFLLLFALISYAPKIQSFGYYNDDWWQIYGGENFGIHRFPEMYASDRPARAFIHAPLYTIFGSQILPYQILAITIRWLGAVGLFWTLSLIWRRQKIEVLLISILFLIYPGFLEQPNAFDYISHQFAMALMIFSIGFSVKTFNSTSIKLKTVFFFLSTTLSLITFVLMDYYIGMEVYRWLIIGILFFRQSEKINKLWIYKYLLKIIPLSIPVLIFLFWRIFFFKSTRYTTDISRIGSDILSSPFLSILKIFQRWFIDIGDIFFTVWVKRGYKNIFDLSSTDFLVALFLGIFAIGLFVFLNKFFKNYSENIKEDFNNASKRILTWEIEAMIVGFVGAIVCLVPINAAGREVYFPIFNRFSFPSSIGVTISIIAFLHYALKQKWQSFVVSLLIFSSIISHFSNNTYYANRWKETQNLWEQWTWRIPSMSNGTMLTGYYPETIQEGYFIWSPANLLYYSGFPEIMIGAEVLNNDTIKDIQMENPFEKSFRSFYFNFQLTDTLAFSKPTLNSCLRLIDNQQVELSVYDNPLISSVAPYSKIDQIIKETSLNKEMFNQLFGSETSEPTWCYLYEKASLARQFGDWDEIIKLHEKAREKDLKPFDTIEWFPFLQAYAYTDLKDEVNQLAPIINETPYYRYQACMIFSQKDVDPDPSIQSGNQYLSDLFCD